jgi:hypothetical protein
VNFAVITQALTNWVQAKRIPRYITSPIVFGVYTGVIKPLSRGVQLPHTSGISHIIRFEIIITIIGYTPEFFSVRALIEVRVWKRLHTASRTLYDFADRLVAIIL